MVARSDAATAELPLPPVRESRSSATAGTPIDAPVPVAAKSGPPLWLLTILFALVIGGVVSGAYYFLQNGRASASQTSDLKLESVPVAQDTALQTDPTMKYLEITGIRLIQSDAKKVEMRFVAVNHSAAALADLNARIKVVARDTQGVESVVGECQLKSGAVGPYESKEFAAPLATDKKAYELPDWQFLRATIEPVK